MLLGPTPAPRALLAETLGTTGLVLFCTGAAAVNEQTGTLGAGGVAAVCGLVVFVLIQAFGAVSGAHLNPAVSLGFWAAGRLPVRHLAPYWAAQTAGGLLGSALVALLIRGSATVGATVGSTLGTLGGTQPGFGAARGLAAEIGLTFWLMLVVLRVARGAREQGLLAGLTIGAMVALEILVGGPISGASMNPIRSLAPALVSGHLTHAWLYVVGPATGALLAAAADRLLEPGELLVPAVAGSAAPSATAAGPPADAATATPAASAATTFAPAAAPAPAAVS